MSGINPVQQSEPSRVGDMVDVCDSSYTGLTEAPRSAPTTSRFD